MAVTSYSNKTSVWMWNTSGSEEIHLLWEGDEDSSIPELYTDEMGEIHNKWLYFPTNSFKRIMSQEQFARKTNKK